MFPGLLRGELKNDSMSKLFLRLLLTVVLCLPILVLRVLIPTKDIYLIMFFKSLVPCFSVGFVIFGCADYVNMQAGFLELSSQDETLVDHNKYASSDL